MSPELASFTSALRSVKTTNATGGVPRTKAGGLRALQLALEDIGDVALDIADRQSDAEADAAQLTALALDEDEIKEEAERIGRNPNEVAGSVHAAALHRNVVIERNASIIGTELTQELREAGLGSAAATDERILEVRAKLLLTTPKQLQGRAAAAFDKSVRALQNLSAEAQVLRLKNEAEATVGQAVASQLDAASVLADTADTPEEIREFFGIHIDEIKDWKDAHLDMGISEEQMDAGIVQRTQGWLLNNPEHASDIVSEMLDGEDPLITDPKMITTLRQAVKTAGAQLLREGREISQAKRDQRIEDQFAAAEIFAAAGRERRPMTQEEANQTFILDPDGALKFQQRTDDRILAGKTFIPNPALDEAMEVFMAEEPNLDRIVPQFLRLANAGKIDYADVSKARTHVLQRRRGAIFGPRGLAQKSEEVIQLELEQTSFSEIEGLAALTRHRGLIFQMARDNPGIEDDPIKFSEKLKEVEATTRAVLKGIQEAKDKDEETEAKAIVPLPKLQADVREREAKLNGFLSIITAPGAQPLARVKAREEYWAEFAEFEPLWDEMNEREETEERESLGRVTFFQDPTTFIFGQSLPSLAEIVAGTGGGIGRFKSRTLRLERIAARRAALVEQEEAQ